MLAIEIDVLVDKTYQKATRSALFAHYCTQYGITDPRYAIFGDSVDLSGYTIVTNIPEPSALILLGGLGIVGIWRRRTTAP